jgi:DNA mismatch repair protein MutS
MSKKEKNSIFDEYLEFHNEYLKKYGDKSIVLMMVGSFYEMYASNEKGPNLYEISDMLNLQMAKKKTKNNDEDYINMIGFHVSTLTKYLKLLMEYQFSVVVVDQDETQSKFNTSGERKVRKVTNTYSNSTYIESNAVETNNLMVLFIEINDALNSTKKNYSIGINIIDIITCDVIYYELHTTNISDDIFNEVQQIYYGFRPSELIIYEINNSDDTDDFKCLSKLEILPNQVLLKYKKINPTFLKLNYQNTQFSQIYNTDLIKPIEYFELNKYVYATIAMVIGFDYLYQHNPYLIKGLKQPKLYNNHKYMVMYNNAQYQLNIIDYYKMENSKNKSLYSLLNNCCTVMGKRELKTRLCNPYIEKNVIIDIYEMTTNVINENKYDEIRTNLKCIDDIERTFRKIMLKSIQSFDIYNLYNSLVNVINVMQIYLNSSILKKDILMLIDKKKIKLFNKAITYFDETFDVEKLKVNNINECNDVYYCQKIHNDIDEITNKLTTNTLMYDLEKILNSFDENIKVSLKHNATGYYFSTTNIKGKKLENIIKNLKNNIVINGNLIIDKNNILFNYQVSTTKITCIELINHSDEKINLIDDLNKLIKMHLIEDIYNWYKTYEIMFQEIIKMIVRIDYVCNNAYNSMKYNYTKPILNDNEGIIKCNEIRHPIIERIITTEYITNDFIIDDEHSGSVIHGINSSGKSCILKSIFLNLIMGQAGLFVACKNFECSIFKNIFTLCDSSDNIFKGYSSFITEIQQIKNVLKYGSSNSLVLMDECCKSTEYKSSISIVSNLMIHMYKKNIKYLSATHINEISKLEEIKNIPNLKFYSVNVDIKNGELVFYRKINNNIVDDEFINKTYGITVASYFLDKEFVNNCIETKNKIFGLDMLMNTKQSRYNSNLYVNECRICHSKENLETHHIIEQQEYKKNKNKKFHVLKNDMSNLMVLCSLCHDKIHDGKINIDEFI